MVAAVVASLIAMAIGAIVVNTYQSSQNDNPPDGVLGFEGGCEPFTLYAQNRWAALGASVRAEPAPTGEKVGSFAPNELVTTDGWVRSRSAYPTNSPPWNSDAWFHLADNSGWVSFAAVRSDPTSPDPTGLDPDGGRPAPLSETCGGSIRS